MISLIKNWWFVAVVKAELLAQHKNQQFVDRICHLPDNRATLEIIRKEAYYRGTKIAPFLAACGILGDSLEMDSFSVEDRRLCAALLAQRLLKVSGDEDFRFRHLLLIGGLEDKLSGSPFAREA